MEHDEHDGYSEVRRRPGLRPVPPEGRTTVLAQVIAVAHRRRWRTDETFAEAFAAAAREAREG